MLIEAKYFVKARALVQKRNTEDPADEEWQVSLVIVELAAKNYPSALVHMKELAESIEILFDEELVADDLYPEFGQSEEWKHYNEWLDENGYSFVEEPPTLDEALGREEESQ